jgi:hypothetical protein
MPYKRNEHLIFGPHNSTYKLRPCKLRDVSHLHVTVDHYLMKQYSMNKDIQLFGDWTLFTPCFISRSELAHI